MKRNIVVIAVLVLGICCFSGMTVGAAQNEAQEDGWEESGESQAESEESLTENEESSTESGESQAENEESLTEAENGRESEEPQAADGKPEGQELCSLEIPQKLGIVIDPWEIGGQGQIYSEQYVIRNTGDTAGILNFSFLCRAPEGSDAQIRTDSQGLHDGEDKAIYLEMVFGDGTRVPLSQEGTEYEKVLEAGEELTVSFSGEVNENASETWGDGDVEVEGIYSWNTLESTYAAEDESIQDISSEESKEQEAASEESGSEEEPSGASDGQEASSEESSGEEPTDESDGLEEPSKESDSQDLPSGESGAQDASAEGSGLQDIEESGAEEKTSQEGQQGASGQEDTDKDFQMRMQEETDENAEDGTGEEAAGTVQDRETEQ